MRYNRLYKENNFLTPTTDTQTLSEYVEGLCYENLPREAVERAKQLLASDSIALQAKQRANEMMRQAEERSRALKRSANEYCEDALRRTEEAVAEAYDEIKQSRARFRAAANASASAAPGPGGPAGGGRPMYDADKE